MTTRTKNWKGRTWTGNHPPADKSTLMAVHPDRWYLYLRHVPDSLPEWDNYKLVHDGEHRTACNYWFSYDQESRRWSNSRDLATLMTRHPAVFLWVQTFLAVRGAAQGRQRAQPHEFDTWRDVILLDGGFFDGRDPLPKDHVVKTPGGHEKASVAVSERIGRLVWERVQKSGAEGLMGLSVESGGKEEPLARHLPAAQWSTSPSNVRKQERKKKKKKQERKKKREQKQKQKRDSDSDSLSMEDLL